MLTGPSSIINIYSVTAQKPSKPQIKRPEIDRKKSIMDRRRHTHNLPMCGDNLAQSDHTELGEPLITKNHSLFSGAKYKRRNLEFFQRLQIIQFCGLVLTFYNGLSGNIFWLVGVNSFQNLDSEIKPYSKILPFITIQMEWLMLVTTTGLVYQISKKPLDTKYLVASCRIA